MAVHDVIEQAPQQKRNAVLDEVLGLVPAGQHRVDRDALVLAHGDQAFRVTNMEISLASSSPETVSSLTL